MNILNEIPASFIYTYSYNEGEASLCRLEMRVLFGHNDTSAIVESSRKIDPSRSPFLRERIDVLYEASSLDNLLSQLDGLEVSNATYKVVFVHNPDLPKAQKVRFEERRDIERKIGLQLIGEPALKNPDKQFAILNTTKGWTFGLYTKTEPVWLFHQKKPNMYSTALNTRTARAVVNIAVPEPDGIEAIDPCCGIGTVVVEALSMGINMEGSDVNPLVLGGARENIAHFGLDGKISLQDIQNVSGKYDAAVIDMPYNLCSVISETEKLEMLQSARRIAKRVVIVTIEPLDTILKEAGFTIQDRCTVKKGMVFSREVILVK